MKLLGVTGNLVFRGSVVEADKFPTHTFALGNMHESVTLKDGSRSILIWLTAGLFSTPTGEQLCGSP